MNQHLSPGFTVTDAGLTYVPMPKLLKKLSGTYGVLPGYGEQYSIASDKDFICDSYWLAKDLTSQDSPILLFVHGGCFGIQMTEDQVEAMANFREAYGNLSVLLVDYSLTCNGHNYPKQYNEVNLVYEKLISEGHTNVIVMGDSAGGNLAINVLQYLQTKEGHAVYPRGVVGISPCLNASKQEFTGSFRRYDGMDVFSYASVRNFSDAYTNGLECLHNSSVVNIEYNSNLLDWKNNSLVKDGNVLVVVGDHEVLSDEIFRWCEKAGITSTHPENVAIDIDGIHGGLFLSETTAYSSLDDWKSLYSAKTILKFLKEHFN